MGAWRFGISLACSTRYLTRVSTAKKCDILSKYLRKHFTKEKLTLFKMLKENERVPVVFMAPNRVSDVLAADW